MVAGAAGVAVGTSKRGLFWGGNVFGVKGLLNHPLPGLGDRNTSPISGGEPSSTAPLCQASTATEVDVFKFGIRGGTLQGAVGALEAEQEQAGASRAASVGKEVNKP